MHNRFKQPSNTLQTAFDAFSHLVFRTLTSVFSFKPTDEMKYTLYVMSNMSAT